MTQQQYFAMPRLRINVLLGAFMLGGSALFGVYAEEATPQENTTGEIAPAPYDAMAVDAVVTWFSMAQDMRDQENARAAATSGAATTTTLVAAAVPSVTTLPGTAPAPTPATEAIPVDQMTEIGMLLSALPSTERNQLYSLYLQDPVQFRQTLQNRIAQLRAARDRADLEQQRLIQAYYAFSSDKERQELIRQVLESAVRAEFEHKMLAGRERLENLEARLRKLREDYRNREKNADAIIQARVRQLLDSNSPQPPPQTAERPGPRRPATINSATE